MTTMYNPSDESYSQIGTDNVNGKYVLSVIKSTQMGLHIPIT